VATPQGRLANGVDAYTLSGSLVDSAGHPLVGAAARLSASVAPAGPEVSGFTEVRPGVYSYAVTSAKPGNYTVSILFDGMVIGTTPVNFIGVSLGQRTFAPGQALIIDGMGFLPGEMVTVTINSSPLVFAPVAADVNGVVRVRYQLPDDFELGAHSITFAGARSGSVSASFIVGTSGTSVETGGSVNQIGLLPGLLVVLLGVGAAAAVRMRRQIG